MFNIYIDNNTKIVFIILRFARIIQLIILDIIKQ